MSFRTIHTAAAGFIMSIVLAVSGCAAAGPAPEPAPSDPQKNTKQESSEQEISEQAISGDEDPGQKDSYSEDVFDYEEGDQSGPAAEAEMPSKYDLRDVQVKGSGIVPPVRFQNPFGTCWGHGAIAASEISILGSGLAQDDGYTDQTFNLSEKHLAFFTFSALDDPEDPQNGEGKQHRGSIRNKRRRQF